MAGSCAALNDSMTSAILSGSTWCVRCSRVSLYDRTKPLFRTGWAADGPDWLFESCMHTALNECEGPSLSCTANGAGCATVNCGFPADTGWEGSRRFDKPP